LNWKLDRNEFRFSFKEDDEIMSVKLLSAEAKQLLERRLSPDEYRNSTEANGVTFNPRASTAESPARRSTVTRTIRLLRAHGLIPKVSGTHRYVVSQKGRRIITALLTARQANVEQLTALAA